MMDRKQMIVIVFILLILFSLQICITVNSTSSSKYEPYWEEPTNSHSLALQQSEILWEKQIYVLSSTECISTEGVLIFVGSTNSKDKAKILAFEGKTGNELWNLDDVGILVNTEHGIFIGSGINLYLIEPVTGRIKWKKRFLSIRHITYMLYHDQLLYLNGTGINTFIVVSPDGQLVSKYNQSSDFYSVHTDVPFYPGLQTKVIDGEDIYVEQRGSSLYSGYVYDRLSTELLWKIERDSISNFVSIKDNVLWISPNDQIIIADSRSGDVIESIEIIPSINYFDFSKNRQHAGYYLCGDIQLGVIYVILGDSRQVFALDIQF